MKKRFFFCYLVYLLPLSLLGLFLAEGRDAFLFLLFTALLVLLPAYRSTLLWRNKDWLRFIK